MPKGALPSHLRGRVEARLRLADQAVSRRILGPRIRGHGQRRGLLCEFADSRACGRSRRAPRCRAPCRTRPAPTFQRLAAACDQHRARRGAGVAHDGKRVAHARGAAGRLHAEDLGEAELRHGARGARASRGRPGGTAPRRRASSRWRTPGRPAPARSARCENSQSSSSATSIGSAVVMPCPISWRGTITVTVPSGAIASQAVSAWPRRRPARRPAGRRRRSGAR